MRLFWSEVPFLRLLVPFIFGILFFIALPSQHFVTAVGCIFVFAFATLSFNVVGIYYKMKYAFIKGILIQCLLICVGYFIAILHSINTSPDWYLKKQFSFAIVTIKEEPLPTSKTIRALVEINRVISNYRPVNTTGNAIVYFQSSMLSKQLKQGDIVLLRNKFENIQTRKNPGEFDYKTYCKFDNIYQSAYFTDKDWEKSIFCNKNIATFLGKFNIYTRAILKTFITDTTSLGIAEALLLGYRHDIDQTIWQSYSQTGIVHIIAISGMHMAMIYSSVCWLLLLIPWMRQHKNISIVIAIMSMWMFALLIGLPPSVTRAAFMFTLIGVGEMVHRDISRLNNLCVSAFCLLCINPFLIIDVGFQLSYLAVLSLFIFFKRIYQWVYFSNTFIDAIWKLMAATIAAQILTFPICIYYFHQFPILFLLTNLIAIPVTTVILYGEILLVLFAWIKPFAFILGNCISHSICWLNKIVIWISQLHFAVWSGLSINIFECSILFLFVIMICLWLLQRKAMYLSLSLMTIVCLLSSFTCRKMQHLKQHKLIIYNIPKQSHVEFIDALNYYSPDELKTPIHENINRVTIQPSHLYLGVQTKNTSIVQQESSQYLELFQFRNKKIALLLNMNFTVKEVLQVDYLILNSSCNPDAQWIRSHFNANLIVLDSSIPTWKCNRMIKNLEELKLPVFCVNKEGAFVADL